MSKQKWIWEPGSAGELTLTPLDPRSFCFLKDLMRYIPQILQENGGIDLGSVHAIIKTDVLDPDKPSALILGNFFRAEEITSAEVAVINWVLKDIRPWFFSRGQHILTKLGGRLRQAKEEKLAGLALTPSSGDEDQLGDLSDAGTNQPQEDLGLEGQASPSVATDGDASELSSEGSDVQSDLATSANQTESGHAVGAQGQLGSTESANSVGRVGSSSSQSCNSQDEEGGSELLTGPEPASPGSGSGNADKGRGGPSSTEGMASPGDNPGAESSSSMPQEGQDPQMPGPSGDDSRGDLYLVEEEHPGYGGGGGQADFSTASSSNAIKKQVIHLLRKFLSQVDDLFRKVDGSQFWDPSKVWRAVAYQPHSLPRAKFNRPKARETWLWVDVSGSVMHLSNFIISLVEAAAKERVKVVVGSEAHPQVVVKKWMKHEELPRIVADANNYIEAFEDQIATFFKKHRIPVGATIVIWSDYMDINIYDTKKLARLLKPYNVVWLCSHDPDFDADYTGNESFKIEKLAKKQGHKFLWSISSLQGIKKALKTISLNK